jgi:hypothetical protein
MGYQTAHTLSVKHKDEIAIIAEFRKACTDAEYCLTEIGNTNNESSWWNSEDDLKEFSKKYPKVLFIMTGNGSDAGGDYWKLYVKNGKSFKADGEITYPKYNPKKLK